jgi:hypothetical protein
MLDIDNFMIDLRISNNLFNVDLWSKQYHNALRCGKCESLFNRFNH